MAQCFRKHYHDECRTEYVTSPKSFFEEKGKKIKIGILYIQSRTLGPFTDPRSLYIFTHPNIEDSPPPMCLSLHSSQLWCYGALRRGYKTFLPNLNLLIPSISFFTKIPLHPTFIHAGKEVLKSTGEDMRATPQNRC